MSGKIDDGNINVNLEELLNNGISRYELAVATAKRAREIVSPEGDKRVMDPKDKTSRKDRVIEVKPVSIAVEEFRKGLWRVRRDSDPEIPVFDNDDDDEEFLRSEQTDEAPVVTDEIVSDDKTVISEEETPEEPASEESGFGDAE